MDALVEQGVCERVRACASDGGPARCRAATPTASAGGSRAARSCSRPSTTCSGTASTREHRSDSSTRSRSTSGARAGLGLLRPPAGRRLRGRRPRRYEGRPQAGMLRALQVHWQGRPRPRALREALARLAWSLGLPATRSRVEFETRAIHAGRSPIRSPGSVNVPIYQTSTYAQDGVNVRCAAATTTRARSTPRARRSSGASRRSRAAEHGVAFSSGMGATTAIMELFAPGPRTLAMNDVYGGTYRLFSKVLEPKGYRFEYARPDRRWASCEARFERAGRSGLARDAVQPAAQDRRHRRGRRARARGRARSSSSTTRSPARTCSSRSRSAPTSSCTPRRSTSAGTPTSSAASRSRTTPRIAERCASCRTRSARCPGRSTAS